MADYGFRGPPRPHPTGYVYPENVSVNKVNVPLLLVLIGAVALVGATYTATIQFAEIKSAIERLGDKLVNELTGQAAHISRLESEMNARTADRFTRSEHELWCSRTEQANAAIGWKCANLEGRLQFAPRLHGWENK